MYVFVWPYIAGLKLSLPIDTAVRYEGTIGYMRRAGASADDLSIKKKSNPVTPDLWLDSTLTVR